MNKEKSNSVNFNKGELEVSQEEKNLALYRSMYYQINAKPDSMSKVFSQKVIITREDIIDLNERVNRKIRMHYQDDGYIATVTVNLSNREGINFECWSEFLSYEWVDANCINSIILKWNFNIRMPQYEYPQNHVLMVKLSNGLRPEEMLNLIFSGKIEDFDEMETNTFPIAARVDFIEPILGDELLNIVSEWIRGLKENRDKKNPFIIFLRKYRKRVAQYFNYCAFIMITFLGTAIINKLVHGFNADKFADLTSNQFLVLFDSVVVMYVILFASLKTLNNIARKIYDTLAQYGQGFAFSITKGDKKRQDEIRSYDEKNAKSIIAKFVFSLIFNVACGIIASFLI